MDRYIAQLIAMLADLATTYTREVPPIPEDIEDALELFDDYLAYAPNKVSSYSDLAIDHFPPESMLSDDQVKLLYRHISKFLKAFSISLSLPREMPVRTKYDLVRSKWPQYDLIPNTGHRCVVDFCTGSSTDCELGAYCSCIAIEHDAPIVNDERPDHYYNLDPNKAYPIMEDGNYNYLAMWENYTPIDKINSQFIHLLIASIIEAAKKLSTKETMNCYRMGRTFNLHNLDFLPIIDHLQLDIEEFPGWQDLTAYEADAISKVFMRMLDNLQLNEYLVHQNYITRYEALLLIISLPAARVGEDVFVFNNDILPKKLVDIMACFMVMDEKGS